MTARAIALDNSKMILSSEELIKLFENARVQKNWSKLEMANKASVPYSWVVDLYRNKPQKPDMRRAQRILNALGLSNPIEESENQIVEKFRKLGEAEKRMFVRMLDSITKEKN